MLTKFYINGRLSIKSLDWVNNKIALLTAEKTEYDLRSIFKVYEWADKNCNRCFGRGVEGEIDGVELVCSCVCKYLDKNIDKVKMEDEVEEKS